MRFVMFVLFVLSTLGCENKNVIKDSPSPAIRITKNGALWSDNHAIGTFNKDDSMVSIVAQEGLETFTIRFKKPIQNGVLETFDATASFTTSKIAASVSDFYDLDQSKKSKIRIYVLDNLKNRIAGEFYLYLDRDKKYGTTDLTIYRGKFDIPLEEISF